MSRDPSLQEQLTAALERRTRLLVEAREDDALAVRCRESGEALPALGTHGAPMFAALHELRLVDRRIHHIREAIHHAR